MTIRFRVDEKKLSEAIVEGARIKHAQTARVMRRTVVGILRDFQMEAPVLHGRFRAGWSPFLIQEGVSPQEGPNAKLVALGRSEGSFTDGTHDHDRLRKDWKPRITVVNGVFYGEDLEKGRSPQAPAGFHRAILGRWTEHLQKAAREK